ncbi:unnamed protein product [Cuscuta campestris]|uniref:Uncharacterized protein n=1 Tax=Cuscuta campestris TaxID=132261 RepID=A0A484N0E7_9ASTE|nr:unnamed protein product [Cuscuta campestris]
MASIDRCSVLVDCCCCRITKRLTVALERSSTLTVPSADCLIDAAVDSSATAVRHSATAMADEQPRKMVFSLSSSVSSMKLSGASLDTGTTNETQPSLVSQFSFSFEVNGHLPIDGYKLPIAGWEVDFQTRKESTFNDHQRSCLPIDGIPLPSLGSHRWDRFPIAGQEKMVSRMAAEEEGKKKRLEGGEEEAAPHWAAATQSKKGKGRQRFKKSFYSQLQDDGASSAILLLACIACGGHRRPVSAAAPSSSV